MGKSRVGVMGGTFDPIHYGHLVAASEVAFRFGLDRVVFVPTGSPWQKRDRRVSGREHRYLMAVLATAPDSRFDVSRVDLDRDGPTYTVDTLRELRKALGGDCQLHFITGVDALNDIATWRDHQQVLEMARLVGVSRPGHTLANEALPADRVEVVDIPALAISSSDCRERVRRGEPITYLVPRSVEQYIEKVGLYLEGGE